MSERKIRMDQTIERKHQMSDTTLATTDQAPPPLTFGESWGAKQITPKFGDLLKVLPDEKAALYFARIIVTALNKTPKIQECSTESILSAIFDLASLNLVPNSPIGHAYLIPYGGVCTVQIGYKGFAELAYRSGEVKMVQADVVRDGDEFKYLKGANVQQFVSHCKNLTKGRDGREVIAAWASVELLNGGVAIEVMESDELAKIERLANAKKESPAWKYFADEMRKKTAVKRLLKLLQISNMETVRAAIELDNKSSGVLPEINGNGKAHPVEHKLTFGDDKNAVTEIETRDEKTGEVIW